MRLTPPTRSTNRRPARGLAAAAAVATVLLGAAGCGSPDITRARLEAAIGPTYKNLYQLQLKTQHGSYDAPPPVSSTARCTKGGRTVTEGGPGNDWSCKMQWLAPNGVISALTYEVTVQPNGCYTAQGPSTLVGQQSIRGIDWKNHTNPLYEFDGCFDITG